MLGRHEWVMKNPVAEYEPIAKRFKPKPNAPREWAQTDQGDRLEVHGDDHKALHDGSHARMDERVALTAHGQV